MSKIKIIKIINKTILILILLSLILSLTTIAYDNKNNNNTENEKSFLQKMADSWKWLFNIRATGASVAVTGMAELTPTLEDRKNQIITYIKEQEYQNQVADNINIKAEDGSEWNGESPYHVTIKLNNGGIISYIAKYEGQDNTRSSPSDIYITYDNRAIPVDSYSPTAQFAGFLEGLVRNNFNQQFYRYLQSQLTNPLIGMTATHNSIQIALYGNGNVGIGTNGRIYYRDNEMEDTFSEYTLNNLPIGTGSPITVGETGNQRFAYRIEDTNLYITNEGKLYYSNGAEVQGITNVRFENNRITLQAPPLPEVFIPPTDTRPDGTPWQNGDVVRGHQFDGTKWNLIEAEVREAAITPVYQRGERATWNGIEHIYDGQRWLARTSDEKWAVIINDDTTVEFFDDNLGLVGSISEQRGLRLDANGNVLIQDNRAVRYRPEGGYFVFSLEANGDVGDLIIAYDAQGGILPPIQQDQGQPMQDGTLTRTSQGITMALPVAEAILDITYESDTFAFDAAFADYIKQHASELKEYGNQNWLVGNDLLYLRSGGSFNLEGFDPKQRQDILNNADRANIISATRIQISDFESKVGRTLELIRETGRITAVISEGDSPVERTETYSGYEGKSGYLTIEYENGMLVRKSGSYKVNIEGGSFRVEYNNVEYNAAGAGISGEYKETRYTADGQTIVSDRTSRYSLEGINPVEDRTTHRDYANGQPGTEIVQHITRLPGGQTVEETRTEGIGSNTVTVYETRYIGGSIDDIGNVQSGQVESQTITTTQITSLAGNGFMKYSTVKHSDTGSAENAPGRTSGIEIMAADGRSLAIETLPGANIDINRGFFGAIKSLSAESIMLMWRNNRWENAVGGTSDNPEINGRVIEWKSQDSRDPFTDLAHSGILAPDGMVYTQDYAATPDESYRVYARYIPVNFGESSFYIRPGWFAKTSNGETQMYAYVTWAPVATSVGDYRTVALRGPDGITYVTFDKDGNVIPENEIASKPDAAKSRSKEREAFRNSLIGPNIEASLNVAVGVSNLAELLGIKISWKVGEFVDSLFQLNLFQQPGDVLCRNIGGGPGRTEVSEDGVAGYAKKERYAWLSVIRAPEVRVLCSSNNDCKKEGFVCNADGVCQQGTACTSDSECTAPQKCNPRYDICQNKINEEFAAPVWDYEQFYKMSFWLKATNNDIVFNIFFYTNESNIGTANGLKLFGTPEQTYVKLPAGKEISSSDTAFFQNSVKYLPEVYTHACFVFENGGSVCNKIAEKTAGDAEPYANAATGATPGETADGISLTWGD